MRSFFALVLLNLQTEAFCRLVSVLKVLQENQ